MAPYTTKNLMEKLADQLDMDRFVGEPDERDPRSWGWPCGPHDKEKTTLLYGSNPHAVYAICSKCAIRMHRQ